MDVSDGVIISPLSMIATSNQIKTLTLADERLQVSGNLNHNVTCGAFLS
jgi:hypothetical protein